MVHALQETWRVLVPEGTLLDLRPVANQRPLEVVDKNRIFIIGPVDDTPGSTKDHAADAAIAHMVAEGWYRAEKSGAFPLAYYWDNYAVFRHPDLGIEIAREMDRPPTELERIAWNVEKNDYRGTFYFLQLETDFVTDDRVIGFHGSGGGGSMMNMDALLSRGFKIANFVDTSGNPPASKVYRAARIILSQPRVDAYYMGGSGVASQEQYHSARGLVKAFLDTQLNVPAVIRVGGNAEEQAIEILERANSAFPAPVEAYGRDDSPEFCADRLAAQLESYTPTTEKTTRFMPPMNQPYAFDTVSGGTVTFDHALCVDCETKACVQTCAPRILSVEHDVPVLNITRDEAKRGSCAECLACEVECYFWGNKGAFITLPIPGLDS